MIDKTSTAWHDCMMHSLEEAANIIENWEYGGAETKEEYDMTLQAAKEVAKLIRRMAERRDKSFYEN